MDLSLLKGDLSTRRIVIFGILGGIMFLSRIYMQWIPNVHFLGLFIAAFTLTYRVYALIPIYVYVLLDGVFLGFSISWVPYLYIWLPLWFLFMLYGKFEPPKALKVPVAMILCALHGFAFGLMYAPFQALAFGLSFRGMILWIIAGIPFDIIHGVGNFATGTLIIPLTTLLIKLEQNSRL